jgi:ATP-dependent DNA helicase DinG
VIFDEAHEIEDVAGQYFGMSISNYQVIELRRDILALARRKLFGSEELDRTLISLEERSEQCFSCFGDGEGRAGFHDQEAFLDRYGEEYTNLLLALELTATQLELVKQAPEELIPLQRRAREISERLQFWMTARDGKFVYWIERRGRGVYLQATPIDVAPILGNRLFDTVDSVVLTSATLAVGGNFDYTESRLGLRGARSLTVSGTFDYQEQALLYVPHHLPEPRNPLYNKAAAEEIIALLNLSRGRAFVLFTSYQQMRLIYDRVSLEVEYPTLMQGTGPRRSLL